MSKVKQVAEIILGMNYTEMVEFTSALENNMNLHIEVVTAEGIIKGMKSILEKPAAEMRRDQFQK